MVDFIKKINIQISFFIILMSIVFLMARDWSSQEEKATRVQLKVWAEKLDRNVKASGVYIKWESDTLPENDAWGTAIKVDYKNEAVAERLFVKSAGEDKVWGSDDDLSVTRMQINAIGIGAGIKEHTAEVTKEAIKGASGGLKEEVSQTLEAAKESVNLQQAGQAAKEKVTGFMNGVKGKLSKGDEEQ